MSSVVVLLAVLESSEEESNDGEDTSELEGSRALGANTWGGSVPGTIKRTSAVSIASSGNGGSGTSVGGGDPGSASLRISGS